MDIAYEKILQQLEPLKEKVFMLPLTEFEVTNLENSIGRSFPGYFREFLILFGLKQDFVGEIMSRIDDFVLAERFLPNYIKQRYVPFGDTGNGDTWVLNCQDTSDKMVYEWYYEIPNELKPLEFTFFELIEKNIGELKSLYGDMPFNHEKKWYAQFSIKTYDEEMILKTIGAVKTKDWVMRQITSAGVYCYESEIILKSKQLRFSRSEYKDWKTPSYYFDLSEKVESLKEGSFIREIDEKLKQKFAGYKLIDYGILAMGDENE